MANIMLYKHIIFDHDGTLIEPQRHTILPGVLELLEILQKSGIKLYIWTARNRASTLEILKDQKILHFFEDLNCGNDGIPKPSIEGLVSMLGEDVDRKAVAIIGDSSSDALGAKNYGVDFLAANWLDASVENAGVLAYFGAKEVFSSAKELKEYLFNKKE